MNSTPETRAGVKLMIVGGFLGAGKTTTILKLAAELESRGRTFGIVTNDQGSDLVDTHYLRSHGLEVNEVTGGCFCCNFAQFAEALAGYGERVDVVLAEPVGSCTDLVATLFRPLRSSETSRFELAPLAVVIDPRRARRFLGGTGSAEINYLFEKQCEEADILVLNKTDAISADSAATLVAGLEERFPGRLVMPVSAGTGAGIAALLDATGDGSAEHHRNADLDISYDRYAASEAALGWLNMRASLSNAGSLDPNEVATGILARIGATSAERGWDVAHAKIYLVGGLDHAKASLVDETAPPRLDDRISSRPDSLEIVLNARIAAPARAVEEVARDALHELIARGGGPASPRVGIHETRAFQPAYPTPTHRITE